MVVVSLYGHVNNRAARDRTIGDVIKAATRRRGNRRIDFMLAGLGIRAIERRQEELCFTDHDAVAYRLDVERDSIREEAAQRHSRGH